MGPQKEVPTSTNDFDASPQREKRQTKGQAMNQILPCPPYAAAAAFEKTFRPKGNLHHCGAPHPRPTNLCPRLGEGVFTPLPFDGKTWYADPLLYTRDGSRYLFCEAFDLAAGRGDIAVIPLSGDGTFGTPQTVLSTGSHLSFPMVFDWNGDTWMLPESSADHSLTL